MTDPEDSASRPRGLPPFVCTPPCTNTPVKYLDRIDGCASGLHATLDECQCLQFTLFPRMAAAIMATDDQPRPGATTSPSPCTVCDLGMVPRPTSPVIYMEECDHYYHHGCLNTSRTQFAPFQVLCPQCFNLSNRVLLWPELFTSPQEKNKLFQLQKRCLGFDVAPQTVLQVDNCYMENGSTSFQLTFSGKCLTVRKKPSPPPQVKFLGKKCKKQTLKSKEQSKVALAQTGGLAVTGTEDKQRKYLLSHIRCPFKREDCLDMGFLKKSPKCEFWHNWPGKAPTKLSRLPSVNDWPQFYCLRSALNRPTEPKCTEPIRVHSEQLARCSNGFHLSDNSDLSSVNSFATKMAKQIMAPVVVPDPVEASLECAFCRDPKTEPLNSVSHGEMRSLDARGLPSASPSGQPNQSKQHTRFALSRLSGAIGAHNRLARSVQFGLHETSHLCTPTGRVEYQN